MTVAVLVFVPYGVKVCPESLISWSTGQLNAALCGKIATGALCSEQFLEHRYKVVKTACVTFGHFGRNIKCWLLQ